MIASRVRFVSRAWLPAGGVPVTIATFLAAGGSPGQDSWAIPLCAAIATTWGLAGALLVTRQAASTLVGFALFQPLRRRIQAAVDRRSDRFRQDAERVLAGFAARARDKVDLDRLRSSLVRAVDDAVAPAAASVWLRRAR